MGSPLVTLAKRCRRSIIFAFFFLGLILYTSLVRTTKNFYEVEPGKFYRSAQLTPSELDEAISKYGIKTVISLRGAPVNSYWYKSERDLLEKRGVAFKIHWLTTDYFLEREELLALLADLKNAPKPILIHCRTGADRTGMVAALYAYEFMKQPKEIAKEQLSSRYWHFKILHPAMDAFVDTYQGEAWAQAYDPCRYPEFITKDTKCSPALAEKEKQ